VGFNNKKLKLCTYFSQNNRFHTRNFESDKGETNKTSNSPSPNVTYKITKYKLDSTGHNLKKTDIHLIGNKGSWVWVAVLSQLHRLCK
jgi:hypothetical protein